jgi:hypothetical protein
LIFSQTLPIEASILIVRFDNCVVFISEPRMEASFSSMAFEDMYWSTFVYIISPMRQTPLDAPVLSDVDEDTVKAVHGHFHTLPLPFMAKI